MRSSDVFAGIRAREGEISVSTHERYNHMPRIELSTTINAPVGRVYGVSRDVESFPDFMDNLQNLTVLERSDDGNRTITAWVGTIREFKMTVKWTQEDRSRASPTTTARASGRCSRRMVNASFAPAIASRPAFPTS